MVHPKILVTGASGFVGRNIVEHFQSSGSVNILSGMRNPDAADWTGHGRVEVVQFDLCNLQNMQTVIQNHQPSHVINCAAYGIHPADRDAGIAHQTNVQGPIELVRMCKKAGVKRFVQIGSCWEYGPKDSNIEESMPLNPIGVYSSTKAAASLLLLEVAKSIEQELVVLRLFGVWGLYEPVGRLVPQILAAAKSSNSVNLTDGQQIRDFSFAHDVASVIGKLTLQDQLNHHKIINIGTGSGISVRDFAIKISRALQCEHLLEFGAVPMRPDEVPSHVADVTRLKEVLGYVPASVNHSQVRELISAEREFG